MILCIGDSWTKGWGVSEAETWPKVLQKLIGTPVAVMAEHGASNRDIHSFYTEGIDKYDPDFIIIGWSGVTRHDIVDDGRKIDMSYVFQDEPQKEHLRKHIFRNHTVDSIAQQFQSLYSQCKANIAFSVFGDQRLLKDTNIEDVSFFEYLAQKAGYNFQYEIPFFEFDYLRKDNIVAQEFFLRNRVTNWKRACVEREIVRQEDRTLFLECGHPNAAGHKLWAEYIYDRMGNKWK